jgi:hypothetical protein
MDAVTRTDMAIDAVWYSSRSGGAVGSATPLCQLTGAERFGARRFSTPFGLAPFRREDLYDENCLIVCGQRPIGNPYLS